MQFQQQNTLDPSRYIDEVPGYSKTRAITTLCHEVARLMYRDEAKQAEDLLVKLRRQFPERSAYISEMVASFMTEFATQANHE